MVRLLPYMRFISVIIISVASSLRSDWSFFDWFVDEDVALDRSELDSADSSISVMLRDMWEGQFVPVGKAFIAAGQVSLYTSGAFRITKLAMKSAAVIHI